MAQFVMRLAVFTSRSKCTCGFAQSIPTTVPFSVTALFGSNLAAIAWCAARGTPIRKTPTITAIANEQRGPDLIPCLLAANNTPGEELNFGFEMQDPSNFKISLSLTGG